MAKKKTSLKEPEEDTITSLSTHLSNALLHNIILYKLKKRLDTSEIVKALH